MPNDLIHRPVTSGDRFGVYDLKLRYENGIAGRIGTTVSHLTGAHLSKEPGRDQPLELFSRVRKQIDADGKRARKQPGDPVANSLVGPRQHHEQIDVAPGRVRWFVAIRLQSCRC